MYTWCKLTWWREKYFGRGKAQVTLLGLVESLQAIFYIWAFCAEWSSMLTDQDPMETWWLDLLQGQTKGEPCKLKICDDSYIFEDDDVICTLDTIHYSKREEISNKNKAWEPLPRVMEPLQSTPFARDFEFRIAFNMDKPQVNRTQVRNI